MSEESIQDDVAIVGAGPAGLCCAIALKQAQPALTICILEKSRAVGSHILSGAILEPSSLQTLLPDWQSHLGSLATPVTAETFAFLTARQRYRVPHLLLPKNFRNKDNWIISLSQLCRQLATIASNLGVDIFTSTSAAQLLIQNNQVMGIKTGDMGLDENGQPSSQYTPGFAIHAHYTLLAEGARGFLSEQVIQHFNLRQGKHPQTYGLGIKELWEVDNTAYSPGRITHTAGWPLDRQTYGGGFIYQYQQNKVGIGFVTALDYKQPQLDPFELLQQYKTHRQYKPLFENARCIGYGARVINEGGYNSLPQCHFPGGALLGCAAGMLNIAKIKRIHNAIASGQLAATAIIQSKQKGDMRLYSQLVEQSNIHKELYACRNVRHYFRFGLPVATILTGLDCYLFRGKTPWNLYSKQKDRDTLQKTTPITKTKNIASYPFNHNRTDALVFANLHHREGQPNHLKILSADTFSKITADYQHPEQRYCPAQVYEYPFKDQPEKLVINAANCLHCKACDIKDPSNQIRWTLPEGGSGPNYTEM